MKILDRRVQRIAYRFDRRAFLDYRADDFQAGIDAAEEVVEDLGRLAGIDQQFVQAAIRRAG